MNKNIIMIALCLTSLAHGSQTNNYCPLNLREQSRLYVVINGKEQFVNHIVGAETFAFIMQHQNLRAFKELEALFKKNNLNIFRTRLDGHSLLHNAISYHYETTDFPRWLYPHQSDSFFDYILAHSAPEEINETFENFRYDGSSFNHDNSIVSLAALHSPTCLIEILNHPAFKADLFLNPQVIKSGHSKSYSKTPQDCIAIIEQKDKSEKNETLIKILKEKFDL